MSFVVVIPARYASTRLPGKPLADIHGKPMVQHVVEKALQSGADRVIVATDDERVQQALAPFAAAAGFEVCMTSPDHQSGTERLAEVCRHYGFAADTIIVNVRGTSPSFPVIIRQVADNLAAASAPMATLSVPIRDAEEAFNPNAVKVVTDREGMPSISVAPASPGIGTALRPAIALREPRADWRSLPAPHRHLRLSRRLHPALRGLGAERARAGRSPGAAAGALVRGEDPRGPGAASPAGGGGHPGRSRQGASAAGRLRLAERL